MEMPLAVSFSMRPARLQGFGVVGLKKDFGIGEFTKSKRHNEQVLLASLESHRLERDPTLELHTAEG